MTTLDKLVTDHGEAAIYDAASQCSRCGYCEQACPTYVTTGKESFSPRGRNQIVRLMLEGKLSRLASAEEALSTCLLCGACTSACYTHVRTADLVLEGLRLIRGEKIPWPARWLTDLMEHHPRRFAALVKAGYWLKRLGVSSLASRLHLPRLIGLRGLEIAEGHMDRLPHRTLSDHYSKPGPSVAGEKEEAANWFYFAACGPNFLFPEVGSATMSLLRRTFGSGRFMNNPCCGLLAYNYGDLEAARRFARKTIEHFERMCGREGVQGEPAMFGDCSSCVAHLKSYPQLFLDEPRWKARAEAFSGRVRDIAQDTTVAGGKRPAAPDSVPGVVTYHDSCRARNGEGVSSQPREVMRAFAGGNFVEIPEPNWCCGGAGAYAFSEPELSDRVLRHKIETLASIQARLVVTSSTSCLIQLAHGLRKYYPDCRVVHISEFIRDRIDSPTKSWDDDKI